MKKKACPICGKKSIWLEITERVNIKFRGEIFNVQDHYYRCSVCGEEFKYLSDTVDPLAEMYRLYAEKHNKGVN